MAKHEKIMRVRAIVDDVDLVYDEKPPAEGWDDFTIEINNFQQRNPDGVYATMEFIEWED